MDDFTEITCLDLPFPLSLASSLTVVHFSYGRRNIQAVYLLQKIFIKDLPCSRPWDKRTVDIMVNQRLMAVIFQCVWRGGEGQTLIKLSHKQM